VFRMEDEGIACIKLGVLREVKECNEDRVSCAQKKAFSGIPDNIKFDTNSVSLRKQLSISSSMGTKTFSAFYTHTHSVYTYTFV